MRGDEPPQSTSLSEPRKVPGEYRSPSQRWLLNFLLNAVRIGPGVELYSTCRPSRFVALNWALPQHEHALTNPVLHAQTRSKSSYCAIVITPRQTLTILNSLTAVLHRTLALTRTATALRSSEIPALRWAEILWEEKGIRVSKRRVDGKDGQTKTARPRRMHRTAMFRCIPS
ncbi:MAG TPA: hypothetical protein VMU26_20730 [Candidatus Polarisedimenticolia bacterium]|nr:hypothetical protein [Candidatus Polarisedimenticolia bacterium]